MNLIQSIENATSLDQSIEGFGDAAVKLIRQGSLKDLLCGTWLGHPLHPLLTDLPIGLWIGSVLIDLLGGKAGRATADKLLAFGTLASVPTAASGLADWVDTYGDERRVGFVHALGNISAMALFAGSYLSRRRGRRGLGVLISLGGTAATTAAGFLGGHMSYRLGAGVDHTRFEAAPDDWTPVASVAELDERTPSLVRAGEADVLLYRDGDRICALANRCSHRGGPLNEGSVDAARRTVTCPWHASVFDLETGAVVRGPAVAPQPVYQTRPRGDKLEVRRR